MTITLHLGVIDLPYTNETTPKRLPKSRPGKQRPRAKKDPVETTGDVAKVLEAKYHVIETFYDLHEEEIAQDFADEMTGALESLIMGAPVPADPLAGATSKLEQRFREYLDREEIAETATPGVPTKAALRGVNHRLKTNRGPRRPSFIDTGLYQSSFKAWTDPT